MKHTQEQFKKIVDALNAAFDGKGMLFELGGSLAHKEASDHDADIVVHTKWPVVLSALKAGFATGGTEIVAVDTTSTTPFPGRPNGQERIQVKMSNEMVIDLFFPKGSIRTE